jgi:hypothetical protein
MDKPGIGELLREIARDLVAERVRDDQEFRPGPRPAVVFQRPSSTRRKASLIRASLHPAVGESNHAHLSADT